jgi:hypothetical protein
LVPLPGVVLLHALILAWSAHFSVYRIIVVSFSANITRQLSVTLHCGSFRSLAADTRCSLHCIPSAASISISARCTCSIQAFLLPPLDTLHCGPPALFDPSISPPTVGHAPLRSSGAIGLTHSPPTVGHAPLRSSGAIGSTHSPPTVGHAPLRSSGAIGLTHSPPNKLTGSGCHTAAAHCSKQRGTQAAASDL